MSHMARDEIPALRKLRDKYDAAKDAMKAGIEQAFEDGVPNARIARSVDYSREYVGRLREKWEQAKKHAGQEKDEED